MQFIVNLRRTVVPAKQLQGIMCTFLMLWLMTMKNYGRALCNGLEAFNNQLVAQFALCDTWLLPRRPGIFCNAVSSTRMALILPLVMDAFGRKMSSSPREDSSAASGRGNMHSDAPPGYRYVLPTLPPCETMKECLFLHCDVAGRPYRLEDFREPLQELGVLKDVTGIGPFQLTHVWLIKLRTRKAKDGLVNAGGLEMKWRFCAVIDPVQQDITLKVHWVPFHVTGEALTKAFDRYGEVKEIRQEHGVRIFRC